MRTACIMQSSRVDNVFALCKKVGVVVLCLNEMMINNIIAHNGTEIRAGYHWNTHQ